MKRAELLRAYQECSGKAGDVARQLAFAGIAVVWIFRVGESSPTFPPALISALLLFGASLGLDLLQYIAQAAIFGLYHRRKELQRTHSSDDREFDMPPYLNWPGIVCFWGKLAAVALGQTILLAYLLRSWRILQ